MINEPARRSVTHGLLQATESSGFKLTGTGALREYGFVGGLSRRIDLSVDGVSDDAFERGVRAGQDALEGWGYRLGSGPGDHGIGRARFDVTGRDGSSFALSFGRERDLRPAQQAAIGAVVSAEDAIGRCVGAVSSGHARPDDYFDLHAVLRSRRFSDEQLLGWASQRHHRVTRERVGENITGVWRIDPREAHALAVGPEQLQRVQRDLSAWSAGLAGTAGPDQLSRARAAHPQRPGVPGAQMAGGTRPAGQHVTPGSATARRSGFGR